MWLVWRGSRLRPRAIRIRLLGGSSGARVVRRPLWDLHRGRHFGSPRLQSTLLHGTPASNYVFLEIAKPGEGLVAECAGRHPMLGVDSGIEDVLDRYLLVCVQQVTL